MTFKLLQTCLAHYSIMSKRLNAPSKVFHHWVAQSV